MSPPSFPPNVPVFRCSLPSTGSLGLVPPLSRYYEALRIPAAPPASLRFLRSTVPPPRLGPRSRSRKAQQLRARDCLSDSPTPDSLAETTGPPRFLKDPT